MNFISMILNEYTDRLLCQQFNINNNIYPFYTGALARWEMLRPFYLSGFKQGYPNSIPYHSYQLTEAELVKLFQSANLIILVIREIGHIENFIVAVTY